MKIINLQAAAASSAVGKNSYWKAVDDKGAYLCGMKIPHYALLKDYNEHNGEIPMEVVIAGNDLTVTFSEGGGDNVTYIGKEVTQRNGAWVVTRNTVATLSYLSKKALKLADGGKIFGEIAKITPTTKEELAELQGDSGSEGNKAKQSFYAQYLAEKAKAAEEQDDS